MSDLHEPFSRQMVNSKQALFEMLLDDAFFDADDQHIARRSEEAPPLSFAQQRLWFFEQNHRDSAAYHIPCILDLSGPLNQEILQQSIDVLVDRHTQLRTYFPIVNGIPVQQVYNSLHLEMPMLDLAAQNPWASAETIAQLAQQAAASLALQPFDLAQGPLLRMCTIRLAARRHWMVLIIHHSIFDGWSKDILLHELGCCYESIQAGRQPALPPLPIDYRDFSVWQHRHMSDPQLRSRARRYWAAKLLEAPPSIDLPSFRRRPEVQTFRGATHEIAIDQQLALGVRQLSASLGVTPFVTLLAAFYVLVSRYSGSNDVVLGTPVSGRTHGDTAGLVGFFVNMLAMRATIDPEQSFIDLIRQVDACHRETAEYHDIPFDQVVELVAPPRDLGRSPLFQIAFVFQQPAAQQLEVGALTGAWRRLPLPIAKFDLTLEIVDLGERYTCYFEYTTDLFEPSQAEQWGRHWIWLLRQLLAPSLAPLGSIGILDADDQHTILHQWNKTQAALPPGSILDRFAAYVAATPEAPAIISDGGTISYAELDRNANQVAQALRACGIGSELLIGVYLDHSPAAIICLLGIWKAGAAYLPLDQAMPLARLHTIIDTARPAIILTNQERAADLAEVPSPHMVYHSASVGQQPSEPPECAIDPLQLAYVIFTSGSTGQPKGVMLGHRGLLNLATAVVSALGITPQSRMLQFASLNFDASIWEIALMLGNGGSLCVVPRQQLLPGAGLIETITTYGVTHLTVPPSVLEVIDPSQLPAGRVVVSAGEALSAATATRWAGQHTIINAYGPTETTVCATLTDYKPHLPISIGRPMTNTQIYILDRSLQPVPIGVAGELYIGGLGLARGYVQRADLTAERFLPNPFVGQHPDASSAAAGESRIYRTGDLARYLPDGMVEFLGRVDQQVKIRGYRIEIGEIEAVINQHPMIQIAAVSPYRRSSGDLGLCAFVVLMSSADTQAALAAALRSHVRSYIPEYMVPSRWVIVPTLPVNTSGKIDRQALARMHEQEAQPIAPADDEQPQSHIESVIASIWQALLDIDAVGIHDNFFDMGGHSLLALQVQQQLSQALERPIDLLQLFRHPTIHGLAHALGTMESPQAPLETCTPSSAAPQRSAAQDRMRQQLERRKLRRTSSQ